jgi:hypothetical protein
VTETSKIDIKVPRDRGGTFDPKLIQRYQRRFPGFDEKIVSMYARGMTVREIQGHLLDLYGLEGSPDLVSTITDAVLETVAEWQNRPLEAMYPLIFFDALRVKIRDEGLVRNKAVNVALGVTADGTKDILGLWIETSEGAKFWLRVMNELRTRGVGDILIAVVDGLKGFPEAINAVFPQTIVQTCIVHLIRNSMDFASWNQKMQSALQPYVGRSIADFALDHGPPTNTIEMGGNERGFQWQITGQSAGAVVPVSGMLVAVPPQQRTCLVSFVASTTKPSPTLSDWIVESWRWNGAC